jgi:hypothetical protein
MSKLVILSCLQYSYLLLQMDDLFSSTLLPNCIDNWCIDALVGQFLGNHRKTVKRHMAAAASAMKSLQTLEDTKEVYWQECRGRPAKGVEADVTTLDGTGEGGSSDDNTSDESESGKDDNETDDNE